MSVLFVQKRSHRAGAQTCLARLLKDPGMKRWQPALLASEPGWLVRECEKHGIPVVVERFPSSRSLLSRWLLNRTFAARVRDRLSELGLRIRIVQSNDHWEGLLGLALRRTLGCPASIFLRSPGMRPSDYLKYQCAKYDFVSVVGEELHSRVTQWNPASPPELIHDGLCEDEFLRPKPRSQTPPARVLVLGSPLDWKGWADFTDALHRIGKQGDVGGMTFDFTGAQPDPSLNNLNLDRFETGRLRFLGRVEEFRDLVLKYDLAINPSRMESFGMAAVEVLAAGVPLLSSRTGVIEQIIQQEEFLFKPHDPSDLASALERLIQHWAVTPLDVAGCQRRIRDRFMVSRSVEKLDAAYQRLLARTFHSPQQD